MQTTTETAIAPGQVYYLSDTPTVRYTVESFDGRLWWLRGRKGNLISRTAGCLTERWIRLSA